MWWWVMANQEDLSNILNNINTFTKEEYELINTAEMKNLAKYDLRKYQLLSNTEPRYFQSLTILNRFGDIALRHKELCISTNMEHLQLHKEILLQLLGILNNLVSNPNLLDTLVDLLNSQWYGNQDFKQFICSLINQELQKLDNLYAQHIRLTTQPLVCYLPEIFDSQYTSVDTADLNDYYTTLLNKYILEP